MTVHSSGDQLERVLARLRTEQSIEQDASQQALLRHECGVLEETRGDENAAVREYLAAFNADQEFCEPLEALVRIYTRRRSSENLAKLLATLVDSADTPQQAARALWTLAAFRQDAEQSYEEAQQSLETAVEADPKALECWLELELLAARRGGDDARMRAIEARADLTQEPTLQGLLLIDLAHLCASGGDLERAAALLDDVAASDGRAQFESRLALEAIAARAGEVELQAHALEGQAELIAQAAEDPDFGNRAGIPRFMCDPQHAADAWLRAGELRRRAGDGPGAAVALGEAAARLPEGSLATRLMIAAADASGEGDRALELARQELGRGADGPSSAALWLRLGQAAADVGDFGEALESYGKALELDPHSVPALTARIDLLGAAEDHQAQAVALQAAAESAGSEEAQASAWLTLAYVWACRVGDVEQAKAAMERAAQCGAPAELRARLARSLAAICAATDWYDEASEQLLVALSSAREQAGVWFELARSRLRRGDAAGALEALAMLTATGEGDDPHEPSVWLGRALAAYAVGLTPTAGSTAARGPAVAALAEVHPDADWSRGLTVVAAMLAARAGESGEAFRLLSREHGREPSDVVVALFLADMFRREGDLPAASTVLLRTAEAVTDPQLAGSLQLEAAFLLWSAGQRAEAVEGFEQALQHVPQAARLVLSWALRGLAPDDLDVRRRAVELAEEAGVDLTVSALEQFGIGVASADGDVEIRTALEELEEMAPEGDIALAAALARLMCSSDDTDRQVVDAALDRLDDLGGAARAVARAERFRLARFVDGDPAAALRAARAWAESSRTVAAALEWLAAAVACDDRMAEVEALHSLAARLHGEARAAVAATAAAITLVDQPGLTQGFLSEPDEVALLMNLELAPPGSAPRRRAKALRTVGAALGERAELDATRLAAWSDLVSGAHEEAKEAFARLTEQQPEDLACWDGLREAAQMLGDHVTTGLAYAQLGNLTRNDKRAAEFWEAAGLTLLEHTQAHDDAEIAFTRALERDSHRAVAFDKLFRRVRARNEDDRLLHLIDARLQVAEDETEITKMYWERARVLRRKGEQDAALRCLKDVTLLEPDHVGALALAGEIHITRGEFTEAAPMLAKLAAHNEAPGQQRLMSGVASADLYEKKLQSPERALEVLLQLYHAGLSTLPVRERLARTAGRVGQWEEATVILEELMEERDTAEGRAEAARLAMAIYRDKLKEPERAEKAVGRLLAESPDDPEGIDLILNAPVGSQLRGWVVPRARKTALRRLNRNPFDARRIRLVADVATAEQDSALQRAALGCLAALEKTDAEIATTIARLDGGAVQVPQNVLDSNAIAEIADPSDRGILVELFALLAPTIAAALGPSLRSEAVGRKNRVDERGGDPLRVEVARWMAALGFGADFDLYVGSRDEHGVRGVPGSKPSMVMGRAITPPLEPATRAAVAGEVFALRRGTTAVLHHDDHTITSIVVAACNEVDIHMTEPAYTIYPEVRRALHSELTRKLKKQLPELCQRIAGSQPDVARWAAAARRSIDRMALVACGDASVLLDAVVGPEGTPARHAIESNERAKDILRFALSPELLALRAKFGMGVS